MEITDVSFIQGLNIIEILHTVMITYKLCKVAGKIKISCHL